jgi:hypothetical protein
MTNIANSASARALTRPRGAAIAGVIFSVLTIVALGLVRYAVPGTLTPGTGTWLSEPGRRNLIEIALDLIPFAGIAFLWLLAVLRSSLGALEDQFFATLFLASGLLFVASLFGAAAVTDALVESVAAGNVRGDTYYFGRYMSDTLLNLFAMKMAAVFIFSTCTIGTRTAIFPRWVAFVGYACGLILLLAIADWRWIALLFPSWTLLVSAQLLLADFRSWRS